jgi:hypothetical protein
MYRDGTGQRALRTKLRTKGGGQLARGKKRTRRDGWINFQNEAQGRQENAKPCVFSSRQAAELDDRRPESLKA